jgi:hypothetical protein
MFFLVSSILNISPLSPFNSLSHWKVRGHIPQPFDKITHIYTYTLFLGVLVTKGDMK